MCKWLLNLICAHFEKLYIIKELLFNDYVFSSINEYCKFFTLIEKISQETFTWCLRRVSFRLWSFSWLKSFSEMPTMTYSISSLERILREQEKHNCIWRITTKWGHYYILTQKYLDNTIVNTIGGWFWATKGDWQGSLWGSEVSFRN